MIACPPNRFLSWLNDLHIAVFHEAVSSHSLSESDLVLILEELIRGDEQALESLIQHRWDHLVHYAQGFTGNRQDAEDAAQESLWRFWNGREDWRKRGPVSPALLYTITRNVAVDIARSGRATSERVDHVSVEIEYQGTLPDQAAEMDEIQRAVREVLIHLPPRRREIFTLARFHGLSYQAIAEVLGLSPQTVANQVSATFKIFREQLSRFR